MAVSERARWALEQVMVEAGLNKAGERLQLRSSVNPYGLTKTHRISVCMFFVYAKPKNNLTS
ncbi:MAG: hypothetical protein IKS99_04770 [Firmicutes bacterium]|nr:hypothetical protein [Bacillota bacterium]